MKSFLVILSFLMFASCTKELKYTKEQLYDMAKAADASTTFILPRSMEEGVNCTDYPEGCVSAHTVQVQKLNFIGVEFLTEEQAKFAAKKVRGYYSRNWLFDDVSGEPTLEKFVVKSLEAKKP
jgi:hypothetical protein